MDPVVINQWRKAPRLNAFAEFFEQTATGAANQPDIAQPVVAPDLLGYDFDCLTFYDTHRRLWGEFDKHYFASIPYRLEEECRLGAAILRFGLKAWAQAGRPATVYSLGAGAGTLARALAKLGDGRLKTLCCSPTEGNRKSFFAKRGSEDAFFHHGPFFELDDNRYADDHNLSSFCDGYDVLFEDTTFQMYGRDRNNQTGFIAPRLRKCGLLIQVQKLSHPDHSIYMGRERQKDQQFKARFFSQIQIAQKRRNVLDTMDDFQVDLRTSIAALAEHFLYTIVTWNSGNFYTIVSSNSADALRSFVASMIGPAIPADYCHEQIPLGFDRGEAFVLSDAWHWRAPDRVVPKSVASIPHRIPQESLPGSTL